MKKSFKILFRPSTLVRGFWVAVVLLHLFLFARRLLTGNWTSLMDQTRLVLLIGAAIYGTVKMWRVAESLDGPPRKLMSLLLLAIIGHCFVSSADYAQATRDLLSNADWSEVAVAVPVFVIALGLAALAFGSANAPRLLSLHSYFIGSPGKPAFRRFSLFAPLFQRPPPAQI